MLQTKEVLTAPLADRLAWSPEEFALVSGQGRTLVYEHIRGGRLPIRKSGTRTLILREDGLAFLRALPSRAA